MSCFSVCSASSVIGQCTPHPSDALPTATIEARLASAAILPARSTDAGVAAGRASKTDVGATTATATRRPLSSPAAWTTTTSKNDDLEQAAKFRRRWIHAAWQRWQVFVFFLFYISCCQIDLLSTLVVANFLLIFFLIENSSVHVFCLTGMTTWDTRNSTSSRSNVSIILGSGAVTLTTITSIRTAPTTITATTITRSNRSTCCTTPIVSP